VRGLRCSPSHPVTDKGIEHFAESSENGFEPFSNVLFLMCRIESDRGHGGLLTNLTAMMCRRRHRNARWTGVASQRRDIGILATNDAAAISAGRLCRGYEREQEVASISYAVTSIFGPMAPMS
jgi:hypothetical protein